MIENGDAVIVSAIAHVGFSRFCRVYRSRIRPTRTHESVSTENNSPALQTFEYRRFPYGQDGRATSMDVFSPVVARVLVSRRFLRIR